MEFDCRALIKSKKGEDYCHEYDNYLNFFHMLACSDTKFVCTNVPECWSPFVRYLGHEVNNTWPVGWDCDNGNWDAFYTESKDKRRVVEIASSCRPELVHALYCADTEWSCLLKEKHEHQKEFLVTCNASFFRPEIQEYRKKLRLFKPQKHKAILVPCAAAKPYPAPMHIEVQNTLKRVLGEDANQWHLITATGVLGLVPEELWPIMPHYDSGLPNLPRCEQTIAWYFRKHKYTHLVVYSDFYAIAIKDGLDLAQCEGEVKFVLGDHYRDHYENLLLDENIQKLEKAIVDVDRNTCGKWSERT